MIRVHVHDPTGSRLRIDFDPGEVGVAGLIAVAYEMHAELVQRRLLHKRERPCRCDECAWTEILQKRMESYFVKGL